MTPNQDVLTSLEDILDSVGAELPAEAVEAVSGVLSAGLLVVIGFVLLLVILQIAAVWRIYSKAGRSGILCLIPVVNGHVFYKIVWKPIFFWLRLVLSCAPAVLLRIDETNRTYVLIAAGCALVSLILYLISMHRLSTVFGHGGGFTLGLIFFPQLFFPVLGFSHDEYIRYKTSCVPASPAYEPAPAVYSSAAQLTESPDEWSEIK